jgi:hypothetical protein
MIGKKYCFIFTLQTDNGTVRWEGNEDTSVIRKLVEAELCKLE